MNYEKRYKEALERAKNELLLCGSTDCDAAKQIYRFFPELAESEDERNIKDLIDELKCSLRAANCQNDACGGGHEKRIALLELGISWLERQGECETDCPQNHQDSSHPNGCIVLEDFNGGEGFYKLHLDYLNKKQVEEVEEMIRVWNKKPQGKSAPDDKTEHLIPKKGIYYTCIKDYYLSDNTHLCIKGNIYESFFNGPL